MILAFKKAAATDSLWSKLIAQLTKGPYSHVEMHISGELLEANCFSSRELSGCAFGTINLGEAAMWELLEIPTTPIQDLQAAAFAAGSNGKPYDYMDLVDALRGNGGQRFHYGRFCSSVTTELLQHILPELGLPNSFWTVSPNRLYEILITAGFKPPATPKEL